MLYKNFVVCIMSCALLTMVNMIYDQHWQYILLPIGILLWGSYVFFKDNDRNYLKSRGIDPEDVSFDLAINAFKNQGYNVFESANVRSGKLPSADAVTRAKEFNELMQNEDIDFINETDLNTRNE